MQDQRIKCSTHGVNFPAIVCRHLREAGLSSSASYVGWVQAEFDPANREPGDLMAWCNECDKTYDSGGGWNEENETSAGFRVVCEQCFHELFSAQQRLRS